MFYKINFDFRSLNLMCKMNCTFYLFLFLIIFYFSRHLTITKQNETFSVQVGSIWREGM